jgi:hypothetical protein
MRKLVLLTAILSVFVFTSCDDDSTGPTDGDTTGNIFVQSNPAGAQILRDGTNTSQVTPDTLTNLDEGSYDITLRLSEFRDTTVTVQVTAGQTTSVNVTMTTSLSLASFGPVQIFETAGTTAQQPSGLDLSAGVAYGISSGDNDKVDIYYSTDGTGGQPFLVQSANLSSTPGMTRVTKFRVGEGIDLDDGVNSPLQNSGTWTNNMSDRENNYVFLYDNDGHYSKVIISDFGGGQPGNPAWVEITWYYNQTADNPNF